MKHTLLLLGTILLFSCNGKTERSVTKESDYNKFLAVTPIKTSSKNFELWNTKIRQDSMQLTSFGVVAAEYNSYFKKTGNIKYLKKSEQALERAVQIAAIGRSGYYRSLARNYIAQHRFKEALHWADSARTIGTDPNASQGLLFDVHMELGNYEIAQHYLDSIRNMSDFGYLIRLAKWNDYKGDLDTTINFMEKAMVRAEDAKNKSLMLWSYTNLADYYGHAGRIEDSYRHYLKSLELDPQNAYAKKGIAWIVFSYEKNPKEALRILDSVTRTNTSPDYYLLKSEIAQYMGNDLEQLSNLDRYYEMVGDPDYGDMYNGYNLSLYLNETEQYRKAVRLAKKEVGNRPTPQSYSMLAYSYFKTGEVAKARSIVDKYVEGKTYEPNVLLQIAQIYKATGSLERTKEIKEELLGALYELGPNASEEIRSL